ncbi:formiminotetrahydrofolate cyclodeaminase [Actinocorallia herbida]|uniref:Formiminotetrahydrofolate cyclodeaminase n=1 Tax=Actinocorallia herbida TaxID=58109 RepID=A0A3N1DCI0_9ACTN|nr:cyclodeaminase/cyclohydrolase family protein [Actinocorallia herbida]ROO90838.1 formiminotetrahydrofolate cyclodeaminase [Actinocorallia herbida]
MRDQTVGEYLHDLAERVPAPGGGAVAALHAAQAAALLAMVARYSDGPDHAEHAETIEAVVTEADEARATALRLAEEDAAAFTAVTDAYRLPKDSDEEKARRSAAIAAALIGAAAPPAALIALGDRLAGLAETLLPIGNRNVITDVAAAADAVRAAVTTARLNVVINLTGIKDERERARLTERAGLTDDLADRAERVSAAVLQEIGE